MVRAAQKGEAKTTSPEVARTAASIKMKDAKKFASTKHKGLPEKKMKKESVSEDAKMRRQSDEKLAAAHKKFSSMDQSPANSFMKKRIEREINRRKKTVKEAKVDKKLTPLQKIRKRNKGEAEWGTPVGYQTNMRRAVHAAGRGEKKEKGKKDTTATGKYLTKEDMKEAKEKHVLFLIDVLKGRYYQMVGPQEALDKILEMLFNNLKSISVITKVLSILHRSLQEEQISQMIAVKIQER